MTARTRFLLGFALCLAVIFGCGGKTKNAPASLSGKVTYKGQAVGGGTMRLHTTDAGVYNAMLKDDGTYLAADVPIGELVVTIETESINPDRAKQEYGRGKNKMPMSPTPSGASTSTGKYVKIPAKYADPKTSDLRVTLKPGKQTQNLELKD